MPVSESTQFNPEVLKSLRNQLGYAPNDVARLSGIDQARYIDIELGEAAPKAAELSKLAKFFRVREFGFFRRSAPTKSKEISFRARMPSYKGEPGPILDAIEFASGIQRLLSSVSNTTESWRSTKHRRLTIASDAEAESLWWRRELELSDDVQVNLNSPDKFFTFFRSKVESKGISVLVYSFEEKALKGLVLGANSEVPVVLINSFRQQKSSRSFTLAHEFCHVLLAEDGVSNPYEPVGRVERFCNKFAAALLMPRDLLLNLLKRRSGSTTSNATIKWLANKLKVSMEAVVIRLVECQLANQNFWAVWKAQFGGQLPSEVEKGGGGGSEDGPDQGIVKLAYFGFLFGKLIPERFEKSGLTGMAVYKASRLKPQYLPDLARAAQERLSEVQSYGRA